MARQRPKVGIVMGSDSDWPTMEEAAKTLERFGIEYDVNVISCHRTPDRAFRFGREAEKKGYAVIIGGAGGAAHLPGVLAALTTVPVIGVPMETQALGGVDSLYSIVQMPGGVPVAAMAIGKAGARNAAIYAAEILAVSDSALRRKLKAYKRELSKQVDAKQQRLLDSLCGKKGG